MYNDYDPFYVDIERGVAVAEAFAAAAAAERAAGAETEDIPPPLPPVVTPRPPVTPRPVVMPAIVEPGAETEVLVFNGEGELAAMPTAVTAVPTALPLVPLVAGLMSLGFFKALLAKFGPVLLKLMVGAAAFAGFMKLLGIGASDDVQLPIKPGEGKKKRRYSIGHNPRVRTLQKVSRHCMVMLKKHRKVIDEFLPPKRRALPATALARTYL
ncbi:unnamed protein product, partial [marine sediment metagenome]